MHSEATAIRPSNDEQRKLCRMMVEVLVYAREHDMSVYVVDGLWLRANEREMR